MKKKLIIALLVVLCVVGVIVTLSFTVFTIKDVEIFFRTSTSKTWDMNQIEKSGNFAYNKCLLFDNKKEYIQNIEKANPYLKVVNIETSFPSKMIVHVEEREPLFAVTDASDVVLCDGDLKVLEILSTPFTSEKTNAILLENLKIENEYEIGDFLEIEQKAIKNFYSSMIENNKTTSQITGFCKEIKLIEKENQFEKNEPVLEITTFKNRKILIHNYQINLSQKLQKMFFCVANIYDVLLESGNFTSAEIDRCSIVINNNILEENQQEIYAHIYLNDKLITQDDLESE